MGYSTKMKEMVIYVKATNPENSMQFLLLARKNPAQKDPHAPEKERKNV